MFYNFTEIWWCSLQLDILSLTYYIFTLLKLHKILLFIEFLRMGHCLENLYNLEHFIKKDNIYYIRSVESLETHFKN